MRLGYVAILLFTVLTELAVGQSPAVPSVMPRLVYITRTETSAARPALDALVKANWPAPHQAWVAAAGLNRTWFVSEFGSFKAWAESLSIAPKSTVSPPGGNAIVATLRDDLSYRPVTLSGPRAFSVTVVQTHQGRSADYVAERRIVRAAHENANIKENYSVYQISGGLPAGTFFVVTPYSDLGGLDEVGAIHGQAYDRALGDEGRARTRELILSGVAESETLLFVVDPQLGYRGPIK